MLAQRIDDHRRSVDRWKRKQARTEEDQTEEGPLLPEHMCEYEAERHEWRAEVLKFIRDRVESAEVYRLAEADLRVGELLPEKPGSLKEEKFEERASVGFQLRRLAKAVGEVMPRTFDDRLAAS
jgi:hypothetical protein